MTCRSALPGDPFLAYWDETLLRQQEALCSIVLTLSFMVVILMMYVAISFDVTVMVVQPVESMVGLVRRLAENPTLQLEVQSKSKYETESVRIALAKIVGLMQLGFGGAGHEIISANLANSEKVSPDSCQHCPRFHAGCWLRPLSNSRSRIPPDWA